MPGTTAGLPQGSNSLYLNSGMFCDILPRTSNLAIGYSYQFGNVISTRRLTFDYVLPAYPTNDSAAFGEAHAEFTNFRKILLRLFSSGNTTTTERGRELRLPSMRSGVLLGHKSAEATAVLVQALHDRVPAALDIITIHRWSTGGLTAPVKRSPPESTAFW
jgi:hypothetical protein